MRWKEEETVREGDGTTDINENRRQDDDYNENTVVKDEEKNVIVGTKSEKRQWKEMRPKKKKEGRDIIVSIWNGG